MVWRERKCIKKGQKLIDLKVEITSLVTELMVHKLYGGKKRSFNLNIHCFTW